ncbi:MAG: TadE/TadG family type IV pilus assembly protein, partial [Pseudomonadota bacterium]
MASATQKKKRDGGGAAARFARDERGNIAIMFGLLLGVLMLFTGGALDFTRYNAIRADLIESLDAAGLAMAQYDDVGGPEIDNLEGEARNQALRDYGNAFFDENFSHQNQIEDLIVSFDITPQRIRPRASGRIKTLLLNIGDRLVNGDDAGSLENLDIGTSVEITRRGSGRIELALVLDVTGSMDTVSNGERRIDSLKDAVDNLLQVMYGDANNSEFIKIG